MVAAYPDLYAAAGVHSGLAAGSASALSSVLAAMRAPGLGHPGDRLRWPVVPLIVFYDDRDATAHPHAAEAVVGHAIAGIRGDRAPGSFAGEQPVRVRSRPRNQSVQDGIRS